MVTIKPFRGVRYALNKIADLSTVVSQPHDKIPLDLQEKYYQLSPYNIVRIARGKEYPADTPTHNVYTRAKEIYDTWLREDIFVREQMPALYVTDQTFTMPNGQVKTRRGLIAALKLHSYDEGVVLPHERILPKSMADRLSLQQVTQTNLSSIFMLYPHGGINELLQPALAQQPPIEFRDLHENQVLQQFWAVTQPEVVTAVVKAMADRSYVIIADGHHRYETALKYRAEMRAQYPNAPDNAGFNYRMVTLVSLDDPGLVILPTHRLIHLDQPLNRADLLARVAAYFEVTTFTHQAGLETALETAHHHSQPALGLYDGNFTLLTLRSPDIMTHLLPESSATWRMLDVTIAHELFIERVLGIDKEAVANKERVDFIREVNLGYEAVAQRRADYLLILNPTRIEQVQDCTAGGERMPQKSTDFYPKMLNGVTAMPIGIAEQL
jgi:uncharacterized protein (DUF1015 family)